MLITCTLKGCYETTEAKLNLETGEVICDHCGRAIPGITRFTIQALKDMKQIVKSTKKAWQFQCLKCKKFRDPLIKDDVAYCCECGEKLNITKQYVQVIKQYKKDDE